MADIKIKTSDDAAAVLGKGEAFLVRAPVEDNLALTILRRRKNTYLHPTLDLNHCLRRYPGKGRID